MPPMDMGVGSVEVIGSDWSFEASNGGTLPSGIVSKSKQSVDVYSIKQYFASNDE